jgi:hypothetical protein
MTNTNDQEWANTYRNRNAEWAKTAADGRAAAIYRTIYRRGVRPMYREEHKSVCQVCQLVASDRLPECLVTSAAEAVLHCQPRKPVAYFFSVLHNECKERGLFLYDLLAKPPGASGSESLK